MLKFSKDTIIRSVAKVETREFKLMNVSVGSLALMLRKYLNINLTIILIPHCPLMICSLSNPSNTKKNYRYFDFVNVPITQHLITHAVTFAQHREQCQCENCELGNTGGWNTVYMMTFCTEDILKAALATLYGLDN